MVRAASARQWCISRYYFWREPQEPCVAPSSEFRLPPPPSPRKSQSWFLETVLEGDCYPADKGFDALAAVLRRKGAGVVAPPRKFRNVPQFTSDEREEGSLRSTLRIHVERHFSRVQG